MIVMPLALLPEEGDPRMFLPFVTVEIDGVELQMLLDSGAGRSQVVDRPGLATQTEPSAPGVGAFGTTDRSVGRAVVSCRLAGIDAGYVAMTVVPGDLPAEFNLLGQDVLGQLRCLYRLADGELTLHPATPPVTHPIRLGGNRHVHLEADWGDGGPVASAMFDTGASVTVVDERFARLHPELFTFHGTSTGLDATGASAEMQMATMRAPRILGEQLAEAVVAVTDLSAANRELDHPMDLILGWTLLSQADWYVDHDGRRAACLPRPVIARLPTDLVTRFRAVDREHIWAPSWVVHTPSHLDTLTDDIGRRGVLVPLDLKFNADFGALDGNHRIAVAIRLGLADVPVALTRVPELPRPAHAQSMSADDLEVIERAFDLARPGGGVVCDPPPRGDARRMEPLEQQRHVQAIAQRFVEVAPQGWSRLVGNWEAAPGSDGRPVLNYLTLAVVDLGDRWGFGQIDYDEPLYDLVADFRVAAEADGPEGTWTVLDLEVDADGTFRTDFSYDPPKRSNGILDEESIGRFENYLQGWIEQHGPTPGQAS